MRQVPLPNSTHSLIIKCLTAQQQLTFCLFCPGLFKQGSQIRCQQLPLKRPPTARLKGLQREALHIIRHSAQSQTTPTLVYSCQQVLLACTPHPEQVFPYRERFNTHPLHFLSGEGPRNVPAVLTVIGSVPRQKHLLHLSLFIKACASLLAVCH